MSSTTETGHAMMVANFEDLINFCVGYGATYNPSKVGFKTASLKTQLTNAQATLQAVKVAKTNYDNATNQREIAFSTVKTLSTRIKNALAATDATEQTLDDVKTTLNKIQGRRATKKPVAAKNATETKVANSTSQQSFDMLIDHFTQLIQIVSTEPSYAPNEPELSVAGLNAILQNLKAKNTNVMAPATALSNARIERDKALYEENTGLSDTAMAVKLYVKSLFGPTSAQFKQVSRIKFSW